MAKVQARYMDLVGTHYEIGQKLGGLVAGIPPLKAFHSSQAASLGKEDAALALAMFDQWCPGMNEEIKGFADALDIDPAKAVFYGATYLIPRCSHVAVLPGLSENGHVLVGRSYEFSEKCEDFMLVRTSAAGKYAHIGSSLLLMGRDEGLNERGLAVTMSSCGFPVGAPEGMRSPRLRGLQYWAVIRTLLENCADVGEALRFLHDMPIAYNINLLLADRAGNAALFETWDGNKAVRQAGAGERYMCATNHILLPELKQYEQNAMRNSVQRYSTLCAFLDGAKGVTADDIKRLLLDAYPAGMCCHDYENFFGTTKSIVMDVSEGILSVCWGGLEENGWVSARVDEPLEARVRDVQIVQEGLGPEFFEMIKA